MEQKLVTRIQSSEYDCLALLRFRVSSIGPGLTHSQIINPSNSQETGLCCNSVGSSKALCLAMWQIWWRHVCLPGFVSIASPWRDLWETNLMCLMLLESPNLRSNIHVAIPLKQKIARLRLKKWGAEANDWKMEQIGYFLLIMQKILPRHLSSNFQKHNL